MTPGKYPKEHIQYSKHGESLKSRSSLGILIIGCDRLPLIDAETLTLRKVGRKRGAGHGWKNQLEGTCKKK
jgi:hypothetical protein